MDAGAGILLPTYVTGPQSHGWWAAVLLVIPAYVYHWGPIKEVVLLGEDTAHRR